MLEIKDIVFEPEEGHRILDGVSLTIPDGKLIVLTGPNGGGKTSLAKVIAGINVPKSGQVIMDGEDITALDPTERAKKGIAFAFLRSTEAISILLISPPESLVSTWRSTYSSG